MKIAKARRRTKYPKIMKRNIRNVRNGLKHVIGASTRVLFKKKLLHTNVEHTLTKHALNIV